MYLLFWIEQLYGSKSSIYQEIFCTLGFHISCFSIVTNSFVEFATLRSDFKVWINSKSSFQVCTFQDSVTLYDSYPEVVHNVKQSDQSFEKIKITRLINWYKFTLKNQNCSVKRRLSCKFTLVFLGKKHTLALKLSKNKATDIPYVDRSKWKYSGAWVVIKSRSYTKNTHCTQCLSIVSSLEIWLWRGSDRSW